MTTTATYKPNVLCSTATMTEEEWLGWRTTGIGGSDAGTVLGVNPYKTKRDPVFEEELIAYECLFNFFPQTPRKSLKLEGD